MKFCDNADSFWLDNSAPLGRDIPPLEGEASGSVAIVGAGYAGLSAALELRERYGVDVTILEAQAPGWGASGRNAGFACMGSHKLSTRTLVRRYGLEDSQAFHRTMRASVELVAENHARYGIAPPAVAPGELCLAHRPRCAEAQRHERDEALALFGERLELLGPEQLAERGLGGGPFFGGLFNPTGSAVQPLDYVRGLTRAALDAGVRIHAGSAVTAIHREGTGHRLHTSRASFRARHVILATNGYTPEKGFAPLNRKLLPALSNIIITRPLSQGEREEQGWTATVPASDTRTLLHYFRLLPDGRFLFGGRGGTDDSMAGATAMRQRLVRVLQEFFPVFGRAEITHFWRGHVCLARDLVPFVGPLNGDKTIWTAIAWHGNGVAMASLGGRALARMMMEGEAAAKLPRLMTRRLSDFPLSGLRPLYLKGAYLWHAVQDARP